MSYTAGSAWSTFSVMGKKKNLLARDKLPQGISLDESVEQFLLKSHDSDNGGLFVITGQPSAGKTTEFSRIIRELSVDKKIQSNFLPIYSELQNAELNSEQISTDTLWGSIVSGSVDYSVHQYDLAKSMKSYADYCAKNNKKGVIFVDTVDLLLFNRKDISISKVLNVWSEFLTSIIENKLLLVWTCRPYEWSKFREKLPDSIQPDVHKLPALLKSELSPFTELNNPPKIEGFNIQEAWKKWSIDFQSNMPIFAERWSTNRGNNRRDNLSSLDDEILNLISDKFVDYCASDLPGHWLSKTVYPSQILYEWIWNKIKIRLEKVYDIDRKRVTKMQNVLNDFAKNNSLNQASTTKIRLEFSQVLEKFEEIKTTEREIHDFFNVCESNGLLTHNGMWLDYSHQLLFEESVLNSIKSDEEKNQLNHLPFAQIRLVNKQNEFDNLDDTIRWEILSAIGHWTGNIFSYHPMVLLGNAEVVYGEWKRKAMRIDIDVTGERDHNGEKHSSIKDYQNSNGKKALIVNGPPGTGKTHMCGNFLCNQIALRGDIKWAYFTKNKNLSNRFSDMLKIMLNEDPYLRFSIDENDLRDKSHSMALSDLLPFNANKKISDKKSDIGLMDFQVFTTLLKNYFSDPANEKVKRKIKTRLKCPPASDAWAIYLKVILDPITGFRMQTATGEITLQEFDEKMDKLDNVTDYQIKDKGMKELFVNFVNHIHKNWISYPEACARIRSKGTHIGKYDIILIDEVQDMTPPEFALLLETLKEGFGSHSVIICGDALQVVNRSGFSWESILESTYQSLNYSGHPSKSKLQDLISHYESGNIYDKITTIQYVWRNSKKLVQFNNSMRANYGENFAIQDVYREHHDYKDGSLKLSPRSQEKEENSRVLVIESKDDDNFQEIIEQIKEIEKRLSHKNIAILTPYSLKQDGLIPKLYDFKNFQLFDAESVKGLEFESVIVIHPYLINEDEAKSGSMRELDGKGVVSNHNQITKWAQAWKQGKEDPTRKNFDVFNKLYSNIYTRMNVLFSRPEYGLIVISPLKFGSNTENFTDKDRIMKTFGSPKINKDKSELKYLEKEKSWSILSAKNSMLEVLNSPKSVKLDDLEVIDIKSVIEKSIDVAELNANGTEADNERKEWQRTLLNLEKNEGAPRKAIALAGGLNSDLIHPALRLLRADLIEGQSLTIESGDLGNKFAQFFITIYEECNFDVSGELEVDVGVMYYLRTQIKSIIDEIIESSGDYHQLTEFMFERMFSLSNINFDEISQLFSSSNVNFDEISKILGDNNFNFNTISEKITQSNEKFVYKFSFNEAEFYDKIIYTIAEKLENFNLKYNKTVLEEEGMGIRATVWNPRVRENSIWRELTSLIDSKTFTNMLISNPNNKNLVDWLHQQFNDESGVSNHDIGLKMPTPKQISHNLKTLEKEHFDYHKESQIRQIDLLAYKIKKEIIDKNKNQSFSTINSKLHMSVYEHLNITHDKYAIECLHSMLGLEYYSLVGKGMDSEGVDRFISRIMNDEISGQNYKKYILRGRDVLSEFITNISSKWNKSVGDGGEMVLGYLIQSIILMRTEYRTQTSRRGKFLQIYNTNIKNTLRNLNSGSTYVTQQLQDFGFRSLLTRYLSEFANQSSTEKLDLTVQLGSPKASSEFIARLLFTDFFALSNSEKSNYIDYEFGIKTKFTQGGRINGLQRVLLKMTEVSKTREFFFREYTRCLDYFLSGAAKERINKPSKNKTRKFDDNRTNLQILKDDGDQLLLNEQIYVTWEWMLNLLEQGESELKKSWENLVRRKRWKEWESGFHSLLRLDYNETNNSSLKQIERSYYGIESMAEQIDIIEGEIASLKFDIEESLDDEDTYNYENEIDKKLKKVERIKNALRFRLYHFTEAETNKTTGVKKFTGIMRKLYSSHKYNTKLMKNYVDWEIIYTLFKEYGGHTFEFSFDNICEQFEYEVVNEMIAKLDVSHPLEKKIKISNLHGILDFIDCIKNANKVYENICGVDTTATLRKTYFSNTVSGMNWRNEISESLIQYLIHSFNNSEDIPDVIFLDDNKQADIANRTLILKKK